MLLLLYCLLLCVNPGRSVNDLLIEIVKGRARTAPLILLSLWEVRQLYILVGRLRNQFSINVLHGTPNLRECRR